MDPSSMGQGPSVNVGSTQLSSTNKQVSQVDLLPRFHNPAPISVGVPQCSAITDHFVQDQAPRSLSRDFGLYNQIPWNVQPLQMGPMPTFQAPIAAYVRRPSFLPLGAQPALLESQMYSKNNPESLTKSASKRPVHFLTSPKVRAASLIGSTGLHHISGAKKRPAPVEQQLKVQTESSSSVRSKLRESLTAALAMVTHQEIKQLNLGEDDCENNVDSSRKLEIGKQHGKSNSAAEISSGDNSLALVSNEHGKTEGQLLLIDVDSKSKHILQGDEQLEDNNSVVKDELLQDHGLCWESEVSGCIEVKRDVILKNPRLIQCERPMDSKGMPLSEFLASKIEGELFKLYGGVNKKYKEKGRSLLFNLKDRSNPELRERVMSGDIPPERLCSMTAEELASKELSQWRLAKAQELAEMVVLPDSEVDMRRLVKKTHKGEVQVLEVEQDDSVSVEVGLGATMVPQVATKSKEGVSKGQKSLDKIRALRSGGARSTVSSDALKKTDMGDEGIASNPDPKSDLMQELMAHEIKDSEFLPPIVSLDEFMEALDSEPPFENLSAGKAEDKPDEVEDLDSLELEADTASGDGDPRPDIKSGDPGPIVDTLQTSAASELVPGNVVDHAEKNTGIPSKGDVEDTCFDDSKLNSNSSDLRPETRSPDIASKIDSVWEGLIQLNTSCMVSVFGIFKSGEKTSTKDWPNLVEIKGRVRLDAFDKFLKELPSSRSRAVMIVQFCWKEGSPESDRLNMSEAANAYIADGRVGFAEPAAGVEIYMCPPHARTVEMLGKHLPNEHVEALQLSDSGLIGVIVWRRPHTLVSPRPSTHHKHGGSKKHLSRKHGGSGSRALDTPANRGEPISAPVADDDVPPGFGLDAIDDDLPEFEFTSSDSHILTMPSVPPPSRPSEQMRDLIQRYGQDGSGRKPLLNIQPWNDDDDIPEWQPHSDNKMLHQQLQPPLPPLPPAPPVQQQPQPSVPLNVFQHPNPQQLLLNQTNAQQLLLNQGMMPAFPQLLLQQQHPPPMQQLAQLAPGQLQHGWQAAVASTLWPHAGVVPPQPGQYGGGGVQQQQLQQQPQFGGAWPTGFGSHHGMGWG